VLLQEKSQYNKKTIQKETNCSYKIPISTNVVKTSSMMKVNNPYEEVTTHKPLKPHPYVNNNG
jgi:hypothetical protein